MEIKIVAISSIVAAIVAIAGFAISEQKPVFACQTNAIGCQQQGGPGQSFLSPPEVSGCSFFPPVAPCATSSTPPGMGAGPK